MISINQRQMSSYIEAVYCSVFEIRCEYIISMLSDKYDYI